jgi:hypothetical protein
MLRFSDGKVTEVLSDHPLMVKQEAHLSLQSSRRNETSAADRTELAKREPARTEKQAVKFTEVTQETKKSLPKRTCSGYNLGSQLGAIRKDRRPYACGFDKDCAFAHVSVAGKSKDRLSKMVSAIAPNVKSDLTKAIQSRK